MSEIGTTVIADMKRDRETAREYLLFYDIRLTEYNRKKADELSSQPRPDNPQGGGNNGVGNPTESQALRIVRYDESHPEYYWLKAVEILQRSLGERKNIFIKVRREAEVKKVSGVGRPAWVVYTQMHYMRELEDRFLNGAVSISENYVRNLWRELVNQTVEIYLRLKNNIRYNEY
ncbi:MAG: hypothetical protein K6C05_07325 [Anaerovibrio sp.]|nr:hypothetical protein [Anaerovibrio sp.]